MGVGDGETVRDSEGVFEGLRVPLGVGVGDVVPNENTTKPWPPCAPIPPPAARPGR